MGSTVPLPVTAWPVVVVSFCGVVETTTATGRPLWWPSVGSPSWPRTRALAGGQICANWQDWWDERERVRHRMHDFVATLDDDTLIAALRRCDGARAAERRRKTLTRLAAKASSELGKDHDPQKYNSPEELRWSPPERVHVRVISVNTDVHVGASTSLRHAVDGQRLFRSVVVLRYSVAGLSRSPIAPAAPRPGRPATFEVDARGGAGLLKPGLVTAESHQAQHQQHQQHGPHNTANTAASGWLSHTGPSS